MLEIVLVLIAIVILCYKTKKNLHILQLNLYNENNRYIKWVFNNSSNFFSLEILGLLLISLANIFLINNDTLKNIINMGAILVYLCHLWLYRNSILKEQVKKPLVVTARIKRLIGTIIVIYLIPLVCLYIYKDQNVINHFILFIFMLMVYLNTIIIFLGNFINKYTLEKCVYHHFKSKALKKIRNMNNLKVIGITGSYGKTSSKNILADILNIKYTTLPTPRNLNTPYGLIMTINNYLDKFTDIFIAEMGAYVPGEIKELCDMVHPKYGILTRIGTAHLETFGSVENIQKTKFELIESLPRDGVGVLNRDDPKQVSYKLKNKCKILWIGIDEADVDVKASNIKCSNVGTTFDVKFKGDNTTYQFETKLLGKHNVYNILAGLALGREFGIPIISLQQAVRSVKPVEHRLELKKLGYFYQIDDAYNSNPVGAKSALEVLAMMPGVKVVVTPGMVELGDKEKELNKEFGRQIATLSKADYVVLIGEKRTLPIKEGLREKDFDEDNLIVYNDVKEAYNFIRGIKTKKDIYALFENDLPDTYNEK